MNMSVTGTEQPGDDPLGLKQLQDLQPEPGSSERDWNAVSSALDAGDKRQRKTWIGGLAVAASLTLIATLVLMPREDVGPQLPDNMVAAQDPVIESPEANETAEPSAQVPSTEDLIAMSQTMELQLRQARQQVGSMPSELVIYQVELQDLIGQVDDAISVSPDSTELWGQRIVLQTDLMKLYRNQLRRDFSRIASI